MLTVADVARRLRVCKATVYKLVQSGTLPHVRIGNGIRFAPWRVSGGRPAAPRRRERRS